MHQYNLSIAGSRHKEGKAEQMTRKQLEAYRSMQAEIRELKDTLQHLGEGDFMIGNSTIMDYRSGYPIP